MKKEVTFSKIDLQTWCAYNRITCDTAHVHKIHEYYAFGDTNPKYRVDLNGKTIASMIEHFQTAKSIAIKSVKE